MLNAIFIIVTGFGLGWIHYITFPKRVKLYPKSLIDWKHEFKLPNRKFKS